MQNTHPARREAFPVQGLASIPHFTSKYNTRIAQKSSYIEFIAPIASTRDLAQYPENIFPVDLYDNGPILRNLDYTALDILPMLDLRDSSKLGWITLLANDMFSATEEKERNKFLKGSITSTSDVRMNFKDSLISLFGGVSGIDGPGHHMVFDLDNKAGEGVNVIVLISSLRLEANQSMVLDGAVIPLTKDLVLEISSSLRGLTERGMGTIRVPEDDFRLWKHVLPTFVERCRTWKHLPSCKYTLFH